MLSEGDVVGGYRILQPFTTAGGGQSQWTFASKSGRDYFLKRFLGPTYPEEGAPGSAATRDRKRALCSEFEAHHQKVQRLLKPVSRAGGNLVVTEGFFRHGAHYYKVTDKVDVSSISASQLSSLPVGSLLVLLLTVTHSLGVLHNRNLVHGDLKPPNVLVKQLSAGKYTTKLIDFDNCFIAEDPPPPDDVVGDPAYYSPELLAYVTGEPYAALTTESDVFALGLLFTEYVTGKMPVIEGGKGTPAEGILQGGRVRLPVGAHPGLGELIDLMVQADPGKRPTTDDVYRALKLLQRGESLTSDRAPSSASADDGPVPSSGMAGGRLRGRLAGRIETDGKADNARPDQTTEGRLRGSLEKKKPGT